MKNLTFPEPKKPVIIVAGIRLSGGICVKTSEPSLCGGEAVVAATENLLEARLGLETSLWRNEEVEVE